MNCRKLKTNRILSFQGLEDRQLMTAIPVAAPVLAEKAAIVSTPIQLAPIQTAPIQAAPIQVAPIQLTPLQPTPAAQVHAFLQSGVLTITGDSGNDAVTITQPANSPNELILFSSNGTLLNGQNRLDFRNVTGNVNVTFSGVAESLTIGAGSLVSLPANLNVKMGNGTNSFYMYDATVGGSVTLTGGSGTDYATIAESTIGRGNVNGGVNDLTMMLGGGVNGISLSDNVAVERDLNILDPSSAGDTIFMAEGISAGRYVYINTGNGNDRLTLSGVTAGAQLNIQTGGGADDVFLGGEALGVVDPVVADSLYLDLGAGNDSLKIGGDSNGNPGGGVFTKHGATYNGGDGFDDIWNASYQSLSGVEGFETNSRF